MSYIYHLEYVTLLTQPKVSHNFFFTRTFVALDVGIGVAQVRLFYQKKSFY